MSVADTDPPDARKRISVVVLTHNRCAELCRSLQFLQTLPEQPPVIVVDNGSSDHTAECIATSFPQIKLLRAGRNLGAAGRNLGVAHVSTPYVAFSDDDTWWAPGALDAAADLLDRHAGITALNASILVGPHNLPDPACTDMAQSPLETVPGAGPLLIGFMAGAVVMRVPAFVQAGGYWPAFFIGGEEALLAMDMLDAGGQIVYAPSVRVHHWPSTARCNALRQRLIARNAVWTAWLRLPPRLAVQRTWAAGLALPSAGARLRMALDALGGLRLVLANRRVLRASTLELLRQVWRKERDRTA